VSLALLAGCTVLGPKAITSGRQAYSEAIVQTNSQQLLSAVIRMRYAEHSSMLAVASVTANVRVVAESGLQLGFGDDDSYAGNLIPFSGGFVYEENPTISYVPVKGEEYIHSLMAPVSITALAQLTGSVADSDYIFDALISNVNGIYNPAFDFPGAEPDPRFDRFVAIVIDLIRSNRLHWLEDPGGPNEFNLVIDQFRTDHAADVEELMAILGLPLPADTSEKLTIPVFLALDGRDDGSIGVVTRSAFKLMEILAGAIEVPDEDQRRGVALPYPPPAPVGRNLKIHYSDGRPDAASVAVPYRNGWFYIDETDLDTKRYFRLLSVMFSVAVSKSSAVQSGPVLTVPVSR
jgi:hypothetical protein